MCGIPAIPAIARSVQVFNPAKDLIRKINEKQKADQEESANAVDAPEGFEFDDNSDEEEASTDLEK